MSKTTVRSALEPIIFTWASAQSKPVAIAWENVAFKPTAEEPWVQVTLIPAETVSGSFVASEHKGLLHINVFGPAGWGATPVDQMAGSLAAVFHSGLNADGVRVPRPPSIGQGRNDDDGYYMVPVRIRYQLN